MTPGNAAQGRSNAQIQRLAASAAELGRAIRRANALPPGFPEDELLALADALEDAPGADVEARLEAGLYVRERWVEVRRQFVSEASDDPDMPGIDAIAHCLNDTIAELSTLVVAAGKEAEERARPDRAAGTSVVATKTAGIDVVDLQRVSDRTTEDIQQLETTLRSAPVNVHIDQSRHYQFLNFSNSIKQLKFSVKITGALFKGEFLDRAWLDKLMAALQRALAKFYSAWEAARAFLDQIGSIVDAVQHVSRDIADLSGLVRQVMRRIFGGTPRPLQPGTIFRDIYELWCPDLVVIPPGEFMMGSTEAERQWAVGHGASRDWIHVEKPQHRVRIEAPLAVGRYAVTFEEYDRFADATTREKPRDEGWGRGRRPVINVSWEDAKVYVDWLSNETGQPYRLLSEAEWEYAARAGTMTRHWWGDGITSENANFNGNVGRTSETGTYPLNPWGLYETNGNVWEWGEDCWNEDYEGAPDDGSAWTSGDCYQRIIRGGSWKSKPGILRAAYRNRHKAGDRENNIGFRVVRTL
jgi:formylglycine-generating enzyme required for sulfatase activity